MGTLGKQAKVGKQGRSTRQKKPGVQIAEVADDSNSQGHEPARPTRKRKGKGTSSAVVVQGKVLALKRKGVVEKIVDGPNDKSEFLIKWEGDPEDQNTWELDENLPEDMVEEYLREIEREIR